MNHAASGQSARDLRSNTIDPTRPNWMEIDLSALDHNFRLVQEMVGSEVRIIPCVKSAAYGLGLFEVSQRFATLGAETIFCGSYQDAKFLRDSGLQKTDLVIFGSTLPAGIPSFLELRLIPTIHHMEIAKAISAAAVEPTTVYIKVDSGRGRLGISIRTAEEEILKIAAMPNIVIEGIYTHQPFTNAEWANFAQERTTLFDDLIDSLNKKGLSIPVTQARSSSGLLLGIRDRCNAVAPGSILFGKNSLPDNMVDFSKFRPLLSAVKTKVVHVTADAADRTPRKALRYSNVVTGATGVIPFGRKDGHPVAAAGKSSFAIVKGVKAPVLSVSSEQAVLDLSAVPNPRIGDEVTILGKDGNLSITLPDLALWQGSSMNDILLMMRGRLPLVFNN